MDLRSNVNTFWSSIFVDELARAGLTDVCIAPGSRSTPLTLAFAANEGVTVHRHLDERSAAYYALGMALYSRRPVALVCTSGTAAANFHPAVIEAYQSQLPLLLLTADRPPELRDSGANQTIDQIKMFGDHVRWFVDMPVPIEGVSDVVIRRLRTTAARAYAIAGGITSGPVHLNFPFRKPLEPTAELTGGERTAETLGQTSGNPYTTLSRGHVAPSVDQITLLVDVIRTQPRGLIVCGPRSPAGDFSNAVTGLAHASGYPILADSLSGLRHRPASEESRVLGGYNLWMPSAAQMLPEVDAILRIGAIPTSAALAAYVETVAPPVYIHVGEDGQWADDTHLVRAYMQADPTQICLDVTENLRASRYVPDRSWAAQFEVLEAAAWHGLDATLTELQLSDFGAVALVLETAPDDALLFAGNSLPVRHVDALARPDNRRLTVYANRGASGIDGNVSTALGLAAAARRPVIALLGDITFYHDMNGLLALRSPYIDDITFVVLNNDGGGLFHRLPISRLDPPFTDLFLTPHGLNFEPVATLYGLAYRVADNAKSLRSALEWALGDSGRAESAARLVEVRTNSHEDYTQYQGLLAAVSTSVLSSLPSALS